MPSAHARHTAATRARIVAAASTRMLRDGYGQTSIAQIAADAEVAVQTVYNAVGSKRALLDAVLDVAASGEASAQLVIDVMQRRTAAAPDAAGLVSVMAEWFAEVHPRVLPVLDLIRDAAAADPAIMELDRERAARRLAHYRLAAAQLRTLPGAREGEEEAMAAVLWSVGHPQTYRQLVEHEGWSRQRYIEWVTDALQAALTTG